MKLFRLRRKPESGEEERELILDTDTEAEPQTQEQAEAEPQAETETPPDAPTPEPAPETAAPAQEEAPTPEGDLLAQIGAEADKEMEAEEKSSEAEGGAPQGDDPLDPDLVDIFREAKNEVLESSLASELEDIPIQDLLSDLKGVSHRLGVEPRAHPEPSTLETPEPPTEPTTTEIPEPPTEPTNLQTPDPPAEPTNLRTFEAASEPAITETAEPPAEPTNLQTSDPPAEPGTIESLLPRPGSSALDTPNLPPKPKALGVIRPRAGVTKGGVPPMSHSWQSLRSELQASTGTGYGRYIQLGLFLALVGATAIGGALWGAGQLGGGEPTEEPPAVVATTSGVVVRQESQSDVAVLPAVEAPSEPNSEAIPQATPGPQLVYSTYVVERGDTLSSIARVFGISTDYVLWNNPDVIDDPHFLVIGQELLIPSIDGIVYPVQPGDTLSGIADSYQIDVESILSFAPNGLTSLDDDIAGMTLLLPGAVPPSPSGG